MPSARAFVAVPCGVLLSCLLACGGGAGPTQSTPQVSPPPLGPQSASFTGSASTNGAGGCTSVRHTFEAGEGTVTVTLTQASASSARIQLCPTTGGSSLCSIAPFADLAVGASLSARLTGGRSQFVNVVPDACGRSGTLPASELTYTVTVNYPG